MWNPTPRFQISSVVRPSVYRSRSSRACVNAYNTGAVSGSTPSIGPRSLGSSVIISAINDHNVILKVPMLRVRFAPSPTGYLHIGSARTFIFNWLYARHNGGTMILRLDDTDAERNTQASVNSIFDGLKWLGLGWDEAYKQSERLDLHRRTAWTIFEKGLAYRDFTPAHTG